MRGSNAAAVTDAPTEAVLRIPHPALLIGGSLAFLATAAGLSMVREMRLAGGWTTGVIAIALCTAVAAKAHHLHVAAALAPSGC